MSQADDGANGVLEKKGRLRCHKRPKSREERPVGRRQRSGAAVPYS